MWNIQKLKLFLSFFTMCRSDSKTIYANQTMNDFKRLCSAHYGSVNLDYELVNLTVIMRNRDKAPKLEKNSEWPKRMCVKCPRNKCSMFPCNQEMLTMKGYLQGHLLAKFIKEQYIPKFKASDEHAGILNSKQNTDSLKQRTWKSQFKDFHGLNSIINMSNILKNYHHPSIVGYFYKDVKHHAFLKSIVETLDYSEISYKRIQPLICDGNCSILLNSISNQTQVGSTKLNPLFESITSSLCNDVPINCEKFDCDLEKMEEFLIQEKLSFEDGLEHMRENVMAVTVDFSKMAGFLLDTLKTSADINLVSVDNQTLITALAGLNTANQKLIPYGSAIFIELWKNKSQEEFYSLLYNGVRMKFGLYKEMFVKKQEFMNYLKMFADYNELISKISNQALKDITEKEFIDLKTKELKSLLDPLAEMLKKNRVLAKN